jgi:O-methyltransferase
MQKNSYNPVYELYIDLLEKSLTHSIWYDQEVEEGPVARKLRMIAPSIFGRLRGTHQERTEGRVWPRFAHTMIGLPRLENIRYCVETAITEGIAGDLIETGVWRGGACIFMRGILRALGITDRRVWVADSFEGLPKPNVEKSPRDRGDKHHKYKELVVDLDSVKRNFQAYGLLDDQVRFLKGWFKDTLPIAPIEKLAVCRLDGDMYESTMDALDALYPKLSRGGFLIVDDYGAVEGCRLAVNDYRERLGIHENIVPIDWGGVYWRKLS